MTLDADACYRAALAHDERFDGVFFVAVKTTGIYCRPVCRVKPPARRNCEFYRTAAEAEHAGFRACFRCRPELSPGASREESLSRLVARAVARIEAGALHDGGLEGLARQLGVTSRHLRRAVQSELGVSPVELAQTRRLAMAKQLLHDTALPMVDVAFASGFQSVRRFNAAFRARYGRAPTELRKGNGASQVLGDTFTLTLDYRPPYGWPALLDFLAARAIPGVEAVQDGKYLRTARVGESRGWLCVAPHPTRAALRAEASVSLAGAVVPLVARLRRLFDLDAQPKEISEHLGRDERLRRSIRARPGLRVPGAFDGFEAAMRAILGQQVSVAAATTLAGRLARRFGETMTTPHPGLTHLTPQVADIAAAAEPELTKLGVLAARARSLRALAESVCSGRISLEPGSDAERTIDELCALPGVGPWTAHYLAMRALAWPDAFPEEDLGVRKALGGVRGKQARELAEPWRPWRAYAVMHLWSDDT